MPKYKKRSWKEHQILLEYLVDHEVKDAAKHFKLSVGAVRSWLWTIRKQLRETQSAINKIRTLQRISPRIKKLTLSAAIPDEETETLDDDERTNY